ncbi:MAG: hypothetical protein M1817_006919 [Caeruleum heppii]|nr:MAG: hypothetical protein M1817_006919 [Caeruleum heppii]
MVEETTLHIKQLSTPGELLDAADRAFSALSTYLLGVSDMTSAVEAIAAPIAQHFLNGDPGEVESDLEGLWTTLFDTIQQIPHDHPWQDKLVLFVSAIAEHPPPSGPKCLIWGRSFSWANLPLFGSTFRERRANPVAVMSGRDYNETQDLSIDLPDSYKHEAILRQDWTRLNAFLARGNHLRSFGFDLWAIWAMREALEDPLLPVELHLNVPGSAVWIYYAGNQLFESDEIWEPGLGDGDPAKGGSLWDGERGFCRERWNLWRRRFQAVVEYVEVPQETRDFASKAVLEMKRIESSDSDPAPGNKTSSATVQSTTKPSYPL